MGQRGVAKATKAEFKLETFSHSTVCRSFRAFEETRKQSLERRFGKELEFHDTQGQMNSKETEESRTKGDETQTSKRRFPSVADTAARRKGMAEFLKKFLCAAQESNIETASQQFVKYWYEETEKLLI